MKRKVILATIVILTILSGCGTIRSGYSNSDSFKTESYDMGIAVNGISAGGTSSYMDYGDTYISGDLADYSYQFRANGEVKKKETVLDIYEYIEKFSNEKGGYITNLNNNYYGYELESSYGFSDTEIKYIANGNVSFNIEIPKENTQEAIQILDKFANDNDWTVTEYRQTITNYKDVKIVEDSDSYRGYREYTKEELDKILKYAEIRVSLNYRIPREVFGKLGAVLHNFWYNSKEAFLTVLQVVIIIAIGAYISLYLIAIPVWKLFIRSRYKYKKKHEDYFIKEIITYNKELK